MLTPHPTPARARATWLLRAALVLVAFGALGPFARLVGDWVSITRVLGSAPAPLPPRGFDWVRWEDRDGGIVAAYVDRRGPGWAAGLREGDALFALDGTQLFSADDVKRMVERASGRRLVYEVVRLEERAAAGPGPRTIRSPVRLVVEVARYPTFLYPLSPALWTASTWGFALATFVHVIGLAIVAPLARKSRRALRSSALILAGLVWVGGNLVRLILVAAVGPPDLVSPALGAWFEGLTLVSLAGWVLFPALLLRQVLLDTRRFREATRPVRWLVWLPPAVLGGAVAVAALRGSLGPIPPDALLTPILFYVCTFVGAASALVLRTPTARVAGEDGPVGSGWSRIGSGVVLGLAVLGAVFAFGVLPGPTGRHDAAAAAFVILLQLFSLAPVGLLSVATLRYGRTDRVLTRAVVYTVGLGAAFFGVAAGLWALRSVAPQGAEHPLVVAAWLVGVLVLLERTTSPLRRLAAGWVPTERQRARQRLNRFGDRVRTYLDVEALAQDAVRAVGDALGVRSAVLFLRGSSELEGTGWVKGTFHPEPPYFTQDDLDRVWERIEAEGRVWSRNPELNESAMPEAEAARLREAGAALAVPVTSGRGEPVGALVLARKARRGSVYNLEDVEMLRALSGQLALAVERLGLMAREQALVRETAEAQLSALRAQINPHFLFNALNTIAALIAERPAEAEATVGHLAGLFRYVLQTDGRPFVRLEEEARLVRQYLAIEQARFGDKLRVEEAWAPETLRSAVPAFAVQTLVENAVKHGVERKRGGGTVRVGSRRLPDGSIEVVVADTGAGIPALYGPASPDPLSAPPAGGDGAAGRPPTFYGIGLRNVAARLEQLYGRTGLLTHTSVPGEGTSAHLVLPEAEAAPVAGVRPS